MRGFVYEQVGQYAQAIDDYSEVLNAKPDAVQVYFRRGIAYRENGQYDRALTDLEVVVRSRSHPLPNFPFFFGERGVVNFALGRFADAAQDFARVLALDATDQYGALWLYIARSRAGDSDAYELARASSRAHSDQWPHPLLRLYLGNATRAQVTVAASDADSDASEDQHCESDFFLGEYDLLHGAEDMARKLFHDTMDACPASLSAHTGAASELNRIGG
jgi:rhomboid protease GluP